MRKIKPEKMNEMVSSLEPPKEMFPHFGISIEHLPEAKKWEIGKTYYVTLEVKQTSIDIHKMEDKEHGYVGFDVTGIEVLKKKPSYKELPDIE